MNYYFLPDIEGFRTQLTVANFPPVDDAAISAREEIVHVIWSDGARWLVEPLERIAPGDWPGTTGAMVDTPNRIDAEFLDIIRKESASNFAVFSFQQPTLTYRRNGDDLVLRMLDHALAHPHHRFDPLQPPARRNHRVAMMPGKAD